MKKRVSLIDDMEFHVFEYDINKCIDYFHDYLQYVLEHKEKIHLYHLLLKNVVLIT